MAKINLRSYHQLVKSLIETGNINEAIFHCTNILKTYPKNIDTYRLLGEAYLEKGQFTQAADIFQRLLSVIPDDFIANVGLSVIREDEGHQDESIWHMERAFETQPANPTVKDELKRLYGKRDGIEPAKINLTRSALVRLYVRGELYPQAIAEIHAILMDMPERVDIQVILARILLTVEKPIEAIEAANKVVRKYPFCLEANRVLISALNKLNRTENLQTYRQRWMDLDPYAQFIISDENNTSQIPDQKVVLDWPSQYPEPLEGLEPPLAEPRIVVDNEELPGEDRLIEEIVFKESASSEEPVWVFEEETGGAPIEDQLKKARSAYHKGQLDESITIYYQLIRSNESIPEIVTDLKTALRKKPNLSEFWQCLGEALMRSGQTEDAMQAYANAVKYSA